MRVRLVSHSRSVGGEGLPSPDAPVLELIAFCARVSNPANQLNSDTAEKLIRYLIRHKHWSPLEMASACLEIETTRDIAHQIVRHKSAAFQEYSQRYATVDELGFELRAARLQDPANRQNSIETDDARLQKAWEKQQTKVLKAAKKAYQWALSHNIAKEQARAVLPEGLTRTRLLMNATIRTWVHYIELRSANGTQMEHMEVAKACAAAISAVFPLDAIRAAE